MLEENRLGGINEMDKKALDRAKRVDLITLPDEVDGTNCYNCIFISSHKQEEDDIDYAMCTHPEVRQYVNERMCCTLWSGKGEFRPFKREKELTVKL